MPVAKEGFIFIFLIGNEHTEITLPNAFISCINKSGKVHKISRTKTLYFLTIQNMAAVGRNCLCSNNETSKQKRGVRMLAVCSINAWLSPSSPQLGERTARYNWPKQRGKTKGQEEIQLQQKQRSSIKSNVGKVHNTFQVIISNN